ncbi:Tannase/feruloyl esterase [Xylaria nigripes]|nr:Tannase/feruloyl esterase [Xylaria nigripes]
MYQYAFGGLPVVGLALLGVVAASPRYGQRSQIVCNEGGFSQFLPANASIERVTVVEAGSTYGDGPADLGFPIQPTNLPALCAVTVKVTSSPTSSFRLGIFLPDDWNNRSLTVGNSAFGGGINWLEMGAGVNYGFAVISTDTGHISGPEDVSWALNQPEVKTDYGWRAVHGSVVLGKSLIESYYTDAIAYSYYSGCSTGGRQGLKEIQMFPESFDGVLAGASVWFTSHLNPWISKVATFNWPASDAKHLDVKLLPLIAAEVIKQCDGIDGVADGIVSLPEQCNVDFSPLLCQTQGANQTNCLTAAQAQTMKNVYADWRTSNGEFLYNGLLPSSESQMDMLLGFPESSPLGLGYVQDFLLDNASFVLADFNDSIPLLADKLDPGNCTADDYDLTAFRDHGGKLVMYHGTADGLVPTLGSNLYLDRVVNAMGGDLSTTQEFFTFFRVPGMQHCWSTAVDAPWSFGGGLQAGILGNDTWSVPGFKDAQHDMLLALVDWVEKGTTINQVVATTWKTPTDPFSGVLRQRPLCPYPQIAKWDGHGDVNDAESWSCV